MKFLQKNFAIITNPYNRPEIAGNLTVLFLALVYLFVSIATDKPTNAQPGKVLNSSQSTMIKCAPLQVKANSVVVQ